MIDGLEARTREAESSGAEVDLGSSGKLDYHLSDFNDDPQVGLFRILDGSDGAYHHHTFELAIWTGTLLSHKL